MNKPLFRPVIFFVLKSLKQNSFSVCLSIFAVAVSVLLVLLISGVYQSSKSAFLLDQMNLNAVMGARSSPTQLVMNTFYHMDVSPGNLPYRYYTALKKDKRVTLAIPYALGDNYYGYRVVGTEEVIFDKPILKSGLLQFAEGSKFDQTKTGAVFGSQVANHLNIKLNDQINSFHGLDYNEDLKHNQIFTVVGILKPTQTPLDQVILIPLEAFYRTEGHVIRKNNEVIALNADEVIEDEYKEISAIMLQIDNLMAVLELKREANQFGKEATFAFLPEIVPEILDKIGWGVLVLEFVAYVVIFLAGLVILVGIYNGLSQRTSEFAILRALGASRKFIFFRIIGESEIIIFCGMTIGAILYLFSFFLLKGYFYQKTGVYLSFNEIPSMYYWLPSFLAGIGFVAGIIPALKIYRTDVSKIL